MKTYKSNKINSELLGMSFGSARNKLEKSIVFHLARKCGMDTCYRCGEKIDNIDDFSVEHKESWKASNNPVVSFFDINNIAFSHLKCNFMSKHPSLRITNCKNKYGFFGVSKAGEKSQNRNKKYRASFDYNGKRMSVGMFYTPKEAAIAYDKKITEFHGKNAATNKSMGLL